MQQNKANSFILVSFLVLLSACSATRHLKAPEYLLVGNHIIWTEGIPNDKRDLESDLLDLTRQQPNEKIMNLVRLRMRIYNATRDTSHRISRWINKKTGEAPVIFDSLYAVQSIEAMKKYLYYKGYFDAEVDYKVHYQGKKVGIDYQIKPGQLIYIDSVFYEMPDWHINEIVHYDFEKRELKNARAYDIDYLLHERKRIETLMKNNGYLNFKKQYVYFEMDTLNKNEKLSVFVKIRPPENDSIHRLYFIDSIIIYPEVLSGSETVRPENYTHYKGYYFASQHLPFNPKPIINSIFAKTGDHYSQSLYQKTIQRLSELGLFRFVNISFENERADSLNRIVNMIIKLSPAKKQAFTTEVEANTSSDYFLGSRLSLSYQNKNLFHQADRFIANLNGGVETLLDSNFISFNTLDFNTEASFYFPMFLLPFHITTAKSFNPKTHITASYNYFRRLQYFNLNSLTLSYGYSWNESDSKTHILNPIDINLTRLGQITQKFTEILTNNPLLAKSFQEQLIIGSDYSFIYHNTAPNHPRWSWYFRGNLDIAGNTLRAGNLLANQSVKDSIYQLFNRPFSQYIKPDVELRLYASTSDNSAFIFRLFMGAGLSFGNSQVMPYIRQYVAGGSNSLRAFRIRTLGPGSLLRESGQSVFPDQSGDIKLETNREYRFKITGIFHGAIFSDAGNIWMLRADTASPGADFQFNRFYKEIALGTGAGLRMDFSFFVLRFDLGVPVYDPGLPAGQRMRLKGMKPFNTSWIKNNIVLNLAIGYPF